MLSHVNDAPDVDIFRYEEDGIIILDVEEPPVIINGVAIVKLVPVV